MKTTSRRQFLWGVGTSTGAAALGVVLAPRAGLAGVLARGGLERLRFGALDPLVDLMQATPADELLPGLVARLEKGTPLGDLVGAGALANARAHGGTYYDGYHALMALMPAFEMAAQMPAPLAALPVLKVLHRNTRFIHDAGRARSDALEPLEGAAPAADLVVALRARDLDGAEHALAGRELGDEPHRRGVHEELQTVVRDDVNVHRVVLAWRAYDLLRLTGAEQAATMLRQCVRFCIDEDSGRARNGRAPDPIGVLLPELLREHNLLDRERGGERADDAAIERLATTVFSGRRSEAARAAAAALADGVDPEDVGAAISLAATRLLLHDPGRASEQPGKPVGSVHGASVGVHASDAASAWRALARQGGARNAFASLVTAAYHTAGQSQYVDEAPRDQDTEALREDDPAALLDRLAGCVRERDQVGAMQAARRHAVLGHAAGPVFARLLGFAVEQDGALHAEKYFRTAQDEHARCRPAHRAEHLAAFARVVASQQGFPAPGVEEARALLRG
jgi:hypothetical protein